MQIHEKNLEKISLKDEHGQEAGALFFIPYDYGIATRVRELTHLFPALMEAVRPLHPHSDGTVDAADADKLHEAEKELCATLDYVCGVMTSQEAFRTYRPFAVVDGDLWATRVIQAFSCVIPTFNERIEYITRTILRGNK